MQDFPVGRQSQREGPNSLFGNFFAENCMKMKKLDSEGGTHPWCPPWSLTHVVSEKYFMFMYVLSDLNTSENNALHDGIEHFYTFGLFDYKTKAVSE